jgi:hypothetical protein
MKEMKQQSAFGQAQKDTDLQPWVPTYKWFAKVAGAILVFLILVFIFGNIILKPYMNKAPMEITPWLDSSKPKTSILGI